MDITPSFLSYQSYRPLQVLDAYKHNITPLDSARPSAKIGTQGF